MEFRRFAAGAVEESMILIILLVLTVIIGEICNVKEQAGWLALLL